MTDEIIGLQSWFATPPGRYLLKWEQERFDEAVADVFGYHALQLGLPVLNGFATNRIPHRWLAEDGERWGHPVGDPDDQQPTHFQSCALRTDYHALPFAAQSLDLVLAPHALELSLDPHATLREIERVLMPEGRLALCGLNPMSLWGMKQRRAQLAARIGWGHRYLPDAADLIGYWRLRDWLRLLSFEVESVQFGCWRPSVTSAQWLRRSAWMDRAGERWWPILGAAYFVVATKRVPGMRKLEASWKKRVPARPSNAPVSVAGSAHQESASGINYS
jgi:SAM-dependent methyltransferase